MIRIVRLNSLLGIGFVYTANGLLSQASEVMHSLCSSSMPLYLRSRYYGQMRTLCSRLQLYSLGDDALHEHYGQLYALLFMSYHCRRTPTSHATFIAVCGNIKMFPVHNVLPLG